MDGFPYIPWPRPSFGGFRRLSEWLCSMPRRSSKRSALVLGIRIRVLCVMLTGSGSCDPEQAGARGGVLPPVRGRVHPGSGGAGSRG